MLCLGIVVGVVSVVSEEEWRVSVVSGDIVIGGSNDCVLT